ncbi:MAG: GNAT family N-acetyltransferase [Elainella sp. C42_A2020_010]|nr:GNAT family N-acetyltransferase [Elainella sp. C42_A2020_010]RNJ66710.1 MAG: GNAT family N-acetyltransferase [Leptolyngbya sp. IPPAS B-1204]
MSSSQYDFKLATTPEELTAYFELRRLIFVQEQQLFSQHDVDEFDAVAYPIVAVLSNVRDHSESNTRNHPQKHTQSTQVVGVVRIYEVEPGIWYGGRLGTHPDHRRGWQIGKGLIYKAVTTANTWGCQQFLATVQQQNVRFFQRLHWQSLKELSIRGCPHHLMQADLVYYPPVAAETQREHFPPGASLKFAI